MRAVLRAALAALVGAVCARPRTVLVAVALATAGAALYTRDHLGVNTNTDDMFSPELAWRQAYEELKAAFPHDNDTLTLVVDAPTPLAAEQAAGRLAAALAADRKLFRWAERPGHDPFFERHALLFLERGELEALADRLAAAQPLVSALLASPDLAGLLEALARLLASAGDRPPGEPAAGGEGEGLEPVLDALAASVRAAAAGRSRPIDWHALLLGRQDAGGGGRQIVIAKPYLDYRRLFPAEAAIARVRALAATLAPGTRVRVTGGTAIEYEELRSVSEGTVPAALAALVMVVAVLFWGLRSPALVAASVVTLLVGLIWTAAFAAWAVGDLNLISIAFAVLYVGLGVDYAAHLGLRYRVLLAGGVGTRAALVEAVQGVGPALALCALTTGVAFYAFVPTEFSGVRELGLISGTGMFISLAATLVVMPALLAVLPAGAVAPLQAPGGERRRLAGRRQAVVLAVGAALAVLAALGLTRLRFDADPLNLRDPDSESIRTYRDLMAGADSAPWTLEVLVAGRAALERLAARLEALPEVAETRSLLSFVPGEQAAKLAILEDLELLLGGVASPPAAARTAPPGRTRTAAALLALARAAQRSTLPGSERLAAALAALGDPDPATLERLEAAVGAGLAREMRRLGAALEAGAVAVEDLPERLRRDWVAPDGRLRLEVVPAARVEDPAALSRFVAAVAALAPAATGTPVVNLESGRAVVRAFAQAFASAFVLLVVLLLIAMPRPADAFLALLPLVLAALYTAGLMGWLGMPFNFANVIALPLLLGIGVDSGIHVLHRERRAGAPARARTSPRPAAAGAVEASGLATSTTRAIWVSALTTLVGFGNLGFSPHPGTASMGQVLAIGMTATLGSTLLLLPALMRRRRASPERA